MPIFSADFHQIDPSEYRKVVHPYQQQQQPLVQPAQAESDETLWRLATAGGDKLVRLWLVRPRPPLPHQPTASTSSAKPADPRVEYLATLKQHTGVVNVVRWSPKGDCLATAGDDGNILFWVPGEGGAVFGESAEDRAYEREHWRVKSMLRSKSGQEIYDLTWSPDAQFILAGSVDHTASIYDVTNGGQLVHTIAEHTNYVQGVAWDPLNHFIATQSSDRSMHIYALHQGANGEIRTTAVGKNSRIEVHSATPTSATEPASAKSKGKEPERPEIARAASRTSDSSESSRAADTPATTAIADDDAGSVQQQQQQHQQHAMEPPARPSASRRSSTATSISASSPALGPTASGFRHLRSPSPAPLPAVKIAPSASPKSSSTLAGTTAGPAALSSSSSSTGGGGAKGDSQRLYTDANATPFFRRLAWSTDGSLLLTPAGLWEDPYASLGGFASDSASLLSSSSSSTAAAAAASAIAKEKEKEAKKLGTGSMPKPTVYIYSRANVSRPPIAHLPGHQTTSIAIRFNPILWELRPLSGDPGDPDEQLDGSNGGEATAELTITPDTQDVPLYAPSTTTTTATTTATGEQKQQKKKKQTSSLFDLPYRMIYAVATLDVIYLYDTQQAGAIAMFGNLHYASFTDLTWSPDGLTLIVASQDGYCSVVAFDADELGKPYIAAPATTSSTTSHPMTMPTPVTTTTTTTTTTAQTPTSSKATPLVVTGESATTTSPMQVSDKKRPEPSSSSSAAAAEGEGGARAEEGDEERAKKKGKRATLTFHGP